MSDLSVVIVTPTCGSAKLVDAMRSVSEQTYPAHHLMVVDGPQFSGPFSDVIASFAHPKHYKSSDLYLPQNTGRGLGKDFWGHRIFAGIANFVNEDIVIFLDEDNWLEPAHVAQQVANIVDNDLSFSFSLRNIYTEAKEFLFRDNCESLGLYPIWNSKSGSEQYHIDSSAYAFRRSYLVEFGHWWHGGYAQDRKFVTHVREANAEDRSAHRYGCTGGYTLNYRLGSSQLTVQRPYFETGNNFMQAKFSGKYPWAK